MNERSLELLPFPGEAPLRPWSVSAYVRARSGILDICYEISGNLEAIRIPPRAVSPERRGRLWEETCFECFLAPRGASRYWEVNLSPAGHWNVFRFDGYRRGMREERAVGSLPLRIRPEQELLQLSLELNLGAILEEECTLDVGISAVIESRGGGLTHHALAHPGPRADFHRRDGFIIALATGPLPKERSR